MIKPVPKIEKILKSYVKKGDKILDIGCGCAIYKDSTDGIYTGLDITDEDYSLGNPRKVDILSSDDRIPVDDDFFDLIFAVSTFYLIPYYSAALKEFYRVLKPGGRLILFDYNRKIQKFLEVKDNVKYPGWTQKELKNIVSTAGFREC